MVDRENEQTIREMEEAVRRCHLKEITWKKRHKQSLQIGAPTSFELLLPSRVRKLVPAPTMAGISIRMTV